MKTFATQQAAFDWALRAAPQARRRPKVQREQCFGTRKPWTVREVQS